jgi:hypothetical protein
MRAFSCPGTTERQLALGMSAPFWTVHPNYVIVYRPETQPLEIIRLLHGMRDLKQLLES